MEKIILKAFNHRNAQQIAICFNNNSKLNSTLKKEVGARWSQTYKCFYVSLNRQNYEKIKSTFHDTAEIDHTALSAYLKNRKSQQGKMTDPVTAPLTENNPGFELEKKPVMAVTRPVLFYKKNAIYEVNARVLPLMQERLLLKAYSPSTIRTYLQEMSQLLQQLKEIPADDLTVNHLKRYFVYCYEKLHLRENTLHSKINALKFYYEQVLGREKFFWEIPRPKKQLILPKVLGEDELSRLFKALENKKHKAILFTAYSSGLRVSEVVHLKLSDIDSDRMQIFVSRGKGKKDRYVMLSPVLLDILRSYIKQSKVRPVVYLFESPTEAGTAYNARSAQKVFQMAREKAGILKQVSFHCLRHSFATHLLEKGIDIRYIKDLLGHFDIRTTERYLHVKKDQLVNIISPIDDLWEKGKLEI